jgi:DNA repair protein RadA/Sms
VANPSATFLAGRDTGVAGSAVTAVMEGSRPMLIEIQALAVKSGFGTPQRVATGLDHRRLAVLLAVLERRAGLPFHDLDVFVNVTGGMRLIEPASDLAVVAALCSAVHDRPVPADALFVGEVGLGGEVRPVAGLERRMAEAERLGFRNVFLSARTRLSAPLAGTPVAHVAELTRRLAA